MHVASRSPINAALRATSWPSRVVEPSLVSDRYRRAVVGRRADDEVPVELVVGRLDVGAARRLSMNAAWWRDGGMRAVRLAVADGSEQLAVLKAAVDDGLRARRHLDVGACRGLGALANPAATEPSVVQTTRQRPPVQYQIPSAFGPDCAQPRSVRMKW